MQFIDPEDFVDASVTKNVVAKFSGRELLRASLLEKCYHIEIKALIEAGGDDTLDLEKIFIAETVQRMKLCEELTAVDGVYKRECLFEVSQAPATLHHKIQACFDNSFEEPANAESNNRILEADARWVLDHHLDYHPAITVNDFTYRGDIDFSRIVLIIIICD